MDHVNILRDYGLFDTKVPRYTSYPPANRFEPNVGAQAHRKWLAEVRPDEPVSVYIHIPFCRRLCWFCACRTQGTKTLHPVDAYLRQLTAEIARVAAQLGRRQTMARLHLGGGTPTLLNARQMAALLDAIDAHFVPSADYEFSVEIDPTEAAPETLTLLAERGMRRASIGIQDFAPEVQDAIGRHQSFADTKSLVETLRREQVTSLNVDLLYGLPYQTNASLLRTLTQVHALRPDRIALYGYAHVPHMSKRQAMIPSDALPDAFARFEAAQRAKFWLQIRGYSAIGIDHFARPSDSLASAAQSGRLRRNFQGYTDDPCETLIGFGASAISRFRQGYVQNAVATAAYQARIAEGQLAGHKGYAMTEDDVFIADVVEQVMCRTEIDATLLEQRHRRYASQTRALLQSLNKAFPNATEYSYGQLRFKPGMEPLARIVAARIDSDLAPEHTHSLAI